jgi:sulfur carrier protein
MFPRTPDALKVRRRIAAAAAAASGHNTRMDIILNGQSLPLPDQTTLAALLEAQHLAQRRVAVEINGEIVPRSQHAERVLAAGDRVEIVHALGGG